MNAHDAYLESRILTAEPLELVRLLYREAVESVGEAREALRAGDIQRRTRSINRAIEIIAELTSSLQPEEESGIARNLIEIYDYMQRQLLEAHFQQSEPPLEEVNGLLKTILEGWERCQPQAPVTPAATGGQERHTSYSAFDEALNQQYVPLICSY